MADKVKVFCIMFNNEDKREYSAGEVLSGHVVVEVSTGVSVQIKAVKISTRGCAQVCWGEGTRQASSPSSAAIANTSSQCEQVEYFSISQTLKETPDGEEFISLDEGHYEFPFHVELTQMPLVTSFKGKYGSVCYEVTAVLQRPLNQDQTVNREFSVISHIDVNSPWLLSSVSTNNKKMIGCWIFTSGPISLNVNINRRGYCNGDSIPIYAVIENYSSRLIVPKAAIYQIQTFMANGKTKSHTKLVASVRGNHIPSGCTDTWNGKTLKISPVSASILNSSVIRVEYSLAVMAQIPGAKKLKVELPIVIGSIPYNGLDSRSSSLSSHFSMDMSWLALALPEVPEAPPNYADVVSEEECELHSPSYSQSEELERQLGGPAFAYIQEFRFQPPPLYSEVSSHIWCLTLLTKHLTYSE
ncbi:arrestin domain-containing protein 4 isoform X1 [Salmo salar]|uniref:Arrestin domain-containing protein 4 isoform X1 n=1 Tax=Salmo salar TaxID=8030 RepID=A0A1S3KML4_SALSA|nr:arrestin domain-containing protein 4 isoform X1 [Salmo salar]|eukprot:XP_013979578.1 PREDICTED: arrestin domain-containing protein 4 isoform X1 [Salmo salar]